MKNVSVFMEVSDDVYEFVIEPHKKEKTFAKLMASLLKGYMSDEYIRGYAENTLRGMHKASVKSLDSIISNINGSISNLGLYTEALEQNTERGKQYFQDKADKQSSFMENTEDVFVSNEESEYVRSDISSEYWNREKEELKNDIESLKRQNETIFELLRGVINIPSNSASAEESSVRDSSVGNSAVVEEDSKIDEPKVESIEIGEENPTSLSERVIEPIQPVLTPNIVDDDEDLLIEEELDEDIDTTSSDEDILLELLQGNQCSIKL